MTETDFAYLFSSTFEDDYQKYKSFDDFKLERLISRGEISAALSLQIKNRRRAFNKFSRASELFFTSSGLEQASSEAIARHLAERLSIFPKVVDLGCGLGFNSIFLAAVGTSVTAVDCDLDRLRLAKANAAVYGVAEKITFLEEDFLSPSFSDFYENKLLNFGTNLAFFLDPARNLAGDRKTRSLINSKPNLFELLPKIFEFTNNVAVKISPAFDYRELEQLPGDPELELISENGVCKVAMLWFGAFKKTKRRATVLGANQKIFSLTSGPESFEFSRPLNYLYLPDKAVARAQLTATFAAAYDLKLISPIIPLLSASNFKRVPASRYFKTISQGPFSLKSLKRLLKEQKIDRAELVLWHLQLKVEELRERLKLKEGGGRTIFVFSTEQTGNYYILAENIQKLET
ncbi:class I SAM-dependent methyltransferase [Candidatus Falkowbacteria bacterium]|nr:class I SAM-dependent methyltransferase [Candidatus Falkowbacteria bacterium]